jgi:hypothetical protein
MGKGKKKPTRNVATTLVAKTPQMKCRHLPSVRQIPVLAAISRLSLAELERCEVRESATACGVTAGAVHRNLTTYSRCTALAAVR